MKRRHSMPFGAQRCGDNSIRFRLWGPRAKGVNVCLMEPSGEVVLPMIQSPGGWFELCTDQARVGTRYTFQIDRGAKVPDLASRFQPLDVHGPSQVIDPEAFEWTDAGWMGAPWEQAVIYELHVGTFTPQGTFAAATERLDYLVDLGVTAVELMPVGDFPGTRNWGYDGVLLFAPDSQYGMPDDLKRLVQSAHARGLMVMLDVVYNHFGPEGNYLRGYAPQFFTHRHHTPWGEAINFDGPDSRVVRDFFIHNALYWLTEFHFDGLRLDAVHAIIDESNPDILTELAQRVQTEIGGERQVHLVLENDDNAARYLRPARDGHRLYRAQWNDDIHHATHVAITGESDGYYAEYADDPVRRLAHCLAEGFDYQGQKSSFRGGACRGEASRDLPLSSFVSFLQNHDQVGNRALGERMVELSQEQAIRAAMSILLLAPAPPLLFMGEEFGATTPFLFFCDFGPELARAVTEGRRNEFAQFERFNDQVAREQIPDPSARSTFENSKLDWHCVTSASHQRWLKFYRELLKIRSKRIVPYLGPATGERARCEMLEARAFHVGWELEGGRKLSVTANFGEKPISLGRTSSPTETLIYSTGGFSMPQLDPWSVAWFVQV
jgi:maltooligosyltrehalose trehalohydrolase